MHPLLLERYNVIGDLLINITLALLPLSSREAVLYWLNFQVGLESVHDL
jgi:hypothetical protein